jgi:hypothetical protein
MALLTFLETLQEIKKKRRHATPTQIESLSVKAEEAHGADGVRLLHQVLVGLGLKHEEQNHLLKAPPYDNSAHYAGFYNHHLYQQLLPLCQFAYLSEKNGTPEEHACKLATIFANVQEVLLYLTQFSQRNSSRYLLHDACLFDLPDPQTCDFASWRRLAKIHLANPRFRELLPHAQALEKIGHIGKYYEKHNLDRNAIKQQKEVLAYTKKDYKNWVTKPVTHLNETQRSERQERMNQLSNAKAIQRQKLAILCQGLPLPEIDMLILEAFYECYQNAPEHQLLIKNGITPRNIALFNTLKPANDDKAIPNLILDGKNLGYPSIYLKKLDVLSEKGMALAACLGKLTNCCQYLGGAGHDCVIHGITSSNGGFYIVCHGDASNPSFDDPILAQSWVWKGQGRGLCLDSIEVASNNPDKQQAIADMFRLLGHRLCHEFGIPQVNTGAQSGITTQIAQNDYPTQEECFLDYVGYCDSQEQLALANQEMPYLFYGQG